MPETYLIRFTVRPERRQRFLELLTGVLEAMKHEDTFISAQLSESTDKPNNFLLHETWAEREDVVNVQLKRLYRDAWHAELPELLYGDREIEILSPVWDHANRS